MGSKYFGNENVVGRKKCNKWLNCWEAFALKHNVFIYWDDLISWSPTYMRVCRAKYSHHFVFLHTTCVACMRCFRYVWMLPSSSIKTKNENLCYKNIKWKPISVNCKQISFAITIETREKGVRYSTASLKLFTWCRLKVTFYKTWRQVKKLFNQFIIFKLN